MSAATVKTRVCIISDTHTITPFPSGDTKHAYREPFPKSDVLIHCGDITKVGFYEEYETIFEFLKQAPAELKLVIAGNHDITLHKELYLKHLKNKHRNIPIDVDAVSELWTGNEAVGAGIVYLEEGVRTFRLSNGAKFTVYASQWQPEFMDWAFTYPHHVDRFNPTPPVSEQPQAENPIPAHPAIDFMMTHGPPVGILDKLPYGEEVGCPHLRRAVERCKPRLHCFGHIHEGWGAERKDWATKEITKSEPTKKEMLEDRAAKIDISEASEQPLRWGEETLFVNASIMNVHYQPVNAPWIVDIDLPFVEHTGSSKQSVSILSGKSNIGSFQNKSA
ncbi:hypothetical protein ACLMJK_005285 [Lecanora helva]